MALPLNNYNIVDTTHIDAARKVVADVYCEHQLSRLNSKEKSGFRALHNYAPVNKLSINYMEYTSRVLINPGCLGNFYLLQLPLHGQAEIRTGGSKVYSNPLAASLINPSAETSMIWDTGCKQLLVQIERSAMEQQLSCLARSELNAPLVFEPLMSLEHNKKVASWWRFIQFLVSDIDHGSFTELGAAEKNAIERTLLTNLLYALPHNYSSLLENDANAIAPRHVKAAESYMLENLSAPLTIDELVQTTGVSARSLFEGFKRFRGVTPMKRLLQLRLEKVHHDLTHTNRATTVTEIATQYGISQLGRFAAHYKSVYGETPSQTLQRHN